MNQTLEFHQNDPGLGTRRPVKLTAIGESLSASSSVEIIDPKA